MQYSVWINPAFPENKEFIILVKEDDFSMFNDLPKDAIYHLDNRDLFAFLISKGYNATLTRAVNTIPEEEFNTYSIVYDNDRYSAAKIYASRMGHTL